MKGKRLAKSWERQQFFRLDNGWEATVEWNQCYGEFVKALKSPDGKVWQASNGKPSNGLGAEHYNKIFITKKYVDLPDFATSWEKTISENSSQTLVRPEFERMY